MPLLALIENLKNEQKLPANQSKSIKYEHKFQIVKQFNIALFAFKDICHVRGRGGGKVYFAHGKHILRGKIAQRLRQISAGFGACVGEFEAGLA